MCYIKTYQQQYCKFCKKTINLKEKKVQAACARVEFKVKNFGKCGMPIEKRAPENEHDEKECKRVMAAKQAQREEEIAKVKEEDAKKAREEMKKRHEKEAKALEKQLEKGRSVQQRGK